MMSFTVLLEGIVRALAPLAGSFAKKKLERSETVIKILKDLGFTPNQPAPDFESIYAYALVEFGIGQPEPVLEFFRDTIIQGIFKKAFEERDAAFFLRESGETLEWSNVGKKMLEFDIDPRREYVAFAAVFNQIVNLSRTPADVLRDQKLADIHINTQMILEKISLIDKMDEIWSEITRNSYHLTWNNYINYKSGFLKILVDKEDGNKHIGELLINKFKNNGIEVLVLETNGSNANNEVFQKQLEASDIYISVFEESAHFTSKQNMKYSSLNKIPLFVFFRSGRSEFADNGQVSGNNLEQAFLIREFGDNESLCNLIVEGVKIWIVREFRRITAEIKNGELSQDEVRNLELKAHKLQETCNFTLPQGTYLDILSYRMKSWFDVIGFKFERDGKWYDTYFEWTINVPTRRGKFERIVVHGIEGEAEYGHVQRLKNSVDTQRAHGGWLVAPMRVSQAAKAASEKVDIECYTFDELVDQDADFTQYLEWLEREVTIKGIDKAYVPLACIKEEFDATSKSKIAVSRYDESNGWIDGYIDRWLDDPAKKHISILGEFGTGKTWFTLHYAWMALKHYQEAKVKGLKRPRIPVVVPLRDYAKAVTVESLFSEFFFRKHNIGLQNYATFEQLNRMGKLLLIFDGFDEMAAKIDRQEMINNFWQLAKVVTPGAKAILTCRTEHFPEAKEGRSLLNAELQASTSALTGEPPQFEVLQLEKFDENQIRKVLLFKTNLSTVEKIMENEEIMDLLERPVMFEFILDALPEIEEGKPIDLSRVYLYAVERKMDRDIRAERTFTSLSDKLYFLCELSWEMLSTDQMSLNYRGFPDRIRHLFGTQVREQKDLDHWHYDMMGQSMLIRNDDGDYTPAHRSLLEFFVAYKFAGELGILADDFLKMARTQLRSTNTNELNEGVYTWSSYFNKEIQADEIGDSPRLLNFKSENPEKLVTTFGKRPITKAVLDLIVNMIDNDYEKVRPNLLSLIQYSQNRTIDEVGYLGSNAATLLVKLNESALKGENLSGANLYQADLSDADLSDCNLSGCNLSGAILKGTIMERALLRGANLEDIRLDFILGWINSTTLHTDGAEKYEVRFLTSRFFNADDNRLNRQLGISKEPDEQEIVIAMIQKGRAKWEAVINSQYLLTVKCSANHIEILTLEGDYRVFDVNSGSEIQNYNSDVKKWIFADVENAKGLVEPLASLLKAFGATNIPVNSVGDFKLDTPSLSSLWRYCHEFHDLSS